jgi:hypothetical protein
VGFLEFPAFLPLRPKPFFDFAAAPASMGVTRLRVTAAGLLLLLVVPLALLLLALGVGEVRLLLTLVCFTALYSEILHTINVHSKYNKRQVECAMDTEVWWWLRSWAWPLCAGYCGT